MSKDMDQHRVRRAIDEIRRKMQTNEITPKEAMKEILSITQIKAGFDVTIPFRTALLVMGYDDEAKGVEEVHLAMLEDGIAVAYKGIEFDENNSKFKADVDLAIASVFRSLGMLVDENGDVSGVDTSMAELRVKLDHDDEEGGDDPWAKSVQDFRRGMDEALGDDAPEPDDPTKPKDWNRWGL